MWQHPCPLLAFLLSTVPLTLQLQLQLPLTLPLPFMLGINSLFARTFASARASRYNRPLRGLYAGKSLSHGNTVSDFGNRTRRRWLPNVQYCRLYSEALQERVRVRCSTAALREIDRMGGLDKYVLGLGVEELQEGGFAAKLKNRIIEARLSQELHIE